VKSRSADKPEINFNYSSYSIYCLIHVIIIFIHVICMTRLGEACARHITSVAKKRFIHVIAMKLHNKIVNPEKENNFSTLGATQPSPMGLKS